MSANSDGLVANVINTTINTTGTDRTDNNNVSQRNGNNSVQNHNNHVVRDVHRAGIHLFTAIIEVIIA
jgi:hypothetical protein